MLYQNLYLFFYSNFLRAYKIIDYFSSEMYVGSVFQHYCYSHRVNVRVGYGYCLTMHQASIGGVNSLIAAP